MNEACESRNLSPVLPSRGALEIGDEGMLASDYLSVR